MIDELDLLLKQEIPIQCIMEDESLQVVIPVNPKILSLDQSIRKGISISQKILNSLVEEYEEDIKHYLPIIYEDLSEKQIEELRIKEYEKWRKDWEFSFRESKSGFLDLIWSLDDRTIEMGYCFSPVLITNLKYLDGSGRLTKPEEAAEQMRSHPNIIFVEKEKGDPDWILFQKEKFHRFKREDIPFYADDSEHIETAVHAFCSTYLFNIPEGLLLRDFGVKYLNKLLSK